VPRFDHEAKTHLAAVFADDVDQSNEVPGEVQSLPSEEIVPFPGQRPD
jgi:hypothetical protein